MELIKYLILCLTVVTAFDVALVTASEGKEAVDPFCYAVCSDSFGDDACLGLCIHRKFNSGTCIPQRGFSDVLCCCQ
ncbi:hypothetical protein ACP275_06G009900 [Erythranthe tilingii]